MKLRDLTGVRFGRLVVVLRAANRGKRTYWQAICDCGITLDVWADSLVRGTTRSCGCLQREAASSANTTHGMSAAAVYRVWRTMLARCENPSNEKFPAYGGRGIKVCERWHDFVAFLVDMGERPSATHSIDRIDVNGDYEPSNCRWATPVEQARNTRANRVVTYDGIEAPLAAHCERLGLDYKRVHGRLARGWPVDRAFNEPVFTAAA